MEEQVLELLAQGLGRDDTLKTVGCSPEQFQSILATEGFNARLMARAKELTQERISYRYTALEDKVLKHVTSHLDEYDAPGLCKILETTSRHRLANGNGAGHFTNPTAGQGQIVLILPVAMSEQKILKNDRNEVVAIGSRNMSSMPIAGVTQLFSKLALSKTAAKGEEYEQNENEQNERQGETYEAASVA